MANSSTSTISSVNRFLWLAGWHIKATILGVTVLGGLVGALLDAPFLLGTLAFFASPIVAFVSVRHVNQNYKSVLREFHQAVSHKAENLLQFDEEDNVATYTLHSGTGSKIFRKPHMKYSSATMLVTDYSVTIHENNEFDMVQLNADISESTEEIYYDQIASVNYEDGQFWINRTDGHGHSWVSEREPDDALDDIQKRVREYKRQAAKA